MLRLHFAGKLSEGAEIVLEGDLFHHACVVMRAREEDHLKLFNAQDGEFEVELKLVKKKEAHGQIIQKLRNPKSSKPLHLAFSPLKPERMFFLIEKATELGVTDFHPLFMQHTQHTKCPTQKWQDQAIQGVQQSERFTIPTFHTPQKLPEFLQNHHQKIFAALEREDLKLNASEAFRAYPQESPIILIGPEGGFAAHEKAMLLSKDNVVPVSLGEFILRAETAVIAMLSIYQGVSP